MTLTNDEARRAGEMLIAMADGKCVQEPGINGNWVDVTLDRFVYVENWKRCRIKPEPVLRPWTEAEIEAECIKGTVLKYMDSIGPISKLGCDIRVGAQYIGEMSKAVTMLMKYGKVAATGAPCGVYE